MRELPKITLRFVGRFVFAQPLDRGNHAARTTVLALNMGFNEEVGADSHRFVMTAPRRNIDLVSSKPPDQVIVASVDDEQEKQNLEQAVWNLEGHDVAVEVECGKPPFNWQLMAPPESERVQADQDADPIIEIADLKDLLDRIGQRREFNKSLIFEPNPGPLVQGRVTLTQGTARVDQVSEGTTEFVPLNRPKTYHPVKDAFRMADIVNVVVQAPAETRTLNITLTPIGGGPKSLIVIVGEARDVLVTFTNLCTRSAREIDREFAGLYEVFDAPPMVLSRPVPRASAHLGATEDCWAMGFVEYDDVR